MNFYKIFTVLLILLFIASSIYGQRKLSLEADAQSTDRIIFEAVNTNSSNLSAAILSIKSGSNAQEAEGLLSVYGKSYSGNPGYAGYLDISNGDTGLIFRSSDAAGNVRFLTGGNSVANNTRLFINASGNVGVGTDLPKSKLEIANGSLYLSDSASEIILKAPNNSCWAVSVDNSGNLMTEHATCP